MKMHTQQDKTSIFYTIDHESLFVGRRHAIVEKMGDGRGARVG